MRLCMCSARSRRWKYYEVAMAVTNNWQRRMYVLLHGNVRVCTLWQTTNTTPKTMCICSIWMKTHFAFYTFFVPPQHRLRIGQHDGRRTRSASAWMTAKWTTASTHTHAHASVAASCENRSLQFNTWSFIVFLVRNLWLTQFTIHINYLIWNNRCALNRTAPSLHHSFVGVVRVDGFFLLRTPFLHCCERKNEIVLRKWAWTRTTCGWRSWCGSFAASNQSEHLPMCAVSA